MIDGEGIDGEDEGRERGGGEGRLGRAHTIADLREIAKRRTPAAVFDYTDGAAERELSMARNIDAFDRVELRPRVLRGTSVVDTTTEILGVRSALPFAFAPTAFTRMMHHDGEAAVARVAQRAGIPYTLSSVGTTSIEQLAGAAPQGRRWFQLYVWRDRDSVRDLVTQAHEHGYDTLLLTVDTPVPGGRLRDARNGLAIPPMLRPRTLLDAVRHPRWWFHLLTSEPLTFGPSAGGGTVAELTARLFDPTLSLDDLDWLRQTWPGRLAVKGILNAADARLAVDHGANAVVVSNHGGRQLDRVPVPLEVLPVVREAVRGEAEVWVDGGIRSGADIVAALAMGADACLVGRAYLYGLMAGGQAGVQRVVDILRAEIVRTMHLLGVASIADLTPDHAVLRCPCRPAALPEQLFKNTPGAR